MASYFFSKMRGVFEYRASVSKILGPGLSREFRPSGGSQDY